MTYEQWLNRPVYLVQVYTAQVARQSLRDWHRMRVIGRYKRDIPEAKAVRAQVASIMQQYRQAGLHRSEVKAKAQEFIRNPRGWAIRCDIAAGLREMEARDT